MTSRSVRPSPAIPRSFARSLPRAIAPDAPTPLWRAVDEGIEVFKSRSEDDGRPVILVLSDGKDSGPTGFRQKFVSQVEVIDRAREQGVMIYCDRDAQSRAAARCPASEREGCRPR